MFNIISYLRFSKRPPGKKPPPMNEVDVFWDAGSNKLIAQFDDSSTVPVSGATIESVEGLEEALGDLQSGLEGKQPLRAALTAYGVEAPPTIVSNNTLDLTNVASQIVPVSSAQDINAVILPTGCQNVTLYFMSSQYFAPTDSVVEVGDTVVLASVQGSTQVVSHTRADGLVAGLEEVLASPALTGVPTAPTATPGTNTTQLATTAFVYAADLVNDPNRPMRDQDAIDFVVRAGVTDKVAKLQLDDFARTMKIVAPTLWSRLMIVPTCSHLGYLHPFGPGTEVFPTGTAQFVEGGTVTEGTTGAAIAYASNWPNRIQTPAGITNYNTQLAPLEPWFIGSVFTNDSAGPAYHTQSVEFIHWNAGTTSQWMFSFAGFNSDFDLASYLVGVGLQGVSSEYRQDAMLVSDSYHVPHLFGADVKNARKQVVIVADAKVTDATHATATPSTNATTGLWFYPAIRSDTPTTGKLQCLVWVAGGIADIQSEAKMLWPVMQATLMRHMFTDEKTIHFAINGQSNATDYSMYRKQRAFNADGRGITATATAFGGTPISNWVGSNPSAPVRGSQYTGGIYTSRTSGATAVAWPWDVTGTKKIFDWVQGESDTESIALANAYQAQLENLYSFLKADFGLDLKMAVAQIDYSIAYRTGTAQGNFSLSGITGAESGANGTYAIAAVTGTVSGSDAGLITNAHARYSWSKSTYTIARNGSQWEIKNGATLIARSTGDPVDHPQLASGWAFSIGGGTPAFSESRTGNIEIVRKAQREFAKAHPLDVVSYDTRGCTRVQENAAAPDYFWSDAVHLNKSGQTLMAARFKAAVLTK